MGLIEFNRQSENGEIKRVILKDHEQVSEYLEKLFGNKMESFSKMKLEVPADVRIKSNIQGKVNFNDLKDHVENEIKILLEKLNENELVMVYRLSSTFSQIKQTEMNRLYSIEKLSDRTEQFDKMSTSKAKNIHVKHAASYFENAGYDVSLSKMTHQQLVGFVFDKIILISKDELKKAVEVKGFLKKDYPKQIKSIKNKKDINEEDYALIERLEKNLLELEAADEVLNSRNLLEAYQFDLDNKEAEVNSLVENNPDLDKKKEYFEQNLNSEVEWKEDQQSKLNCEQLNDEQGLLESVLSRLDEISQETYAILKENLIGRATEEELSYVNDQIMKTITNKLPEVLKEKLVKNGLTNNIEEYVNKYQGKVIDMFQRRRNNRKGLNSFKMCVNG